MLAKFHKVMMYDVDIDHPKFNQLFPASFATYPENFIKIRSDVDANIQTNVQTNKQTPVKT